jgi:hypothetical protein
MKKVWRLPNNRLNSGDNMTKELVSEKKLLGIINEIISNEFAKIQKKMLSQCFFIEKLQVPTGRFINFRHQALI